MLWYSKTSLNGIQEWPGSIIVRKVFIPEEKSTGLGIWKPTIFLFMILNWNSWKKDRRKVRLQIPTHRSTLALLMIAEVFPNIGINDIFNCLRFGIPKTKNYLCYNYGEEILDISIMRHGGGGCNESSIFLFIVRVWSTHILTNHTKYPDTWNRVNINKNKIKLF